ncbi:MAG TPA: DUF1501 domain-containing protein [Pyrinomonadaceae bacterium]|nr:DUF1501 domain-containing protein [Pyrinomonadaceae bacterium]
MKRSRRNFLRDSACGLTAAAMVSSFEQLNLVNAMVNQQPEVASDYRALVCIFLFGGSDCNNVVIPYTDYNNPTGGTTNGYSNVRGTSQLAIPQADLLQITPANSAGVVYGLHPNLSPEAFNAGQPNGLLGVWNTGKLAILCNVGSLVQPITRAQYASGIGHPYQLFSHSDQQTQQQTSFASSAGQTGWGGRVADKTGSLNGNVVLPMNISVAGTSLFATGTTSRQLAIAPAPTTLANVLVLNWTNGVSGVNPNNSGSSYRTLLGLDLDSFLVKAASDTTNQALTADAVLNQPDPSLTAIFPNTQLGNQLKQVAKLIKLRDTLGMKRQIFFCSLGGYDTHTNQTGSNPTNPAGGGANSGGQGGLLTQLSQAMRAFYDEMVAQTISDKVTQFTLSDFGRTLQPSGSGATTVGSDHAWGGHAFIMGGSVNGGMFYGSLRPDGTGLPYGYPTLALGGPDDTDSRGRWIPTTSVDQYAATLATWYGLAPSDLATVFPNLSRFATSNLGFMAP